MNYKQALTKINAAVAKELLQDKLATLYIRASNGEKWRDTLLELLKGSAELKEKDWTLDASKYFYVDQGEVKYLWRLVFRGDDPISGLSFFASCAMRIALRGVKELDSFPLSEGSSTGSTQQMDT